MMNISMTTPEPLLIVLGGPNGAGKTTAAMTVLPEALRCLEFLNADEIARGLSPLNPGSVRIQASRLMLGRAEQLLSRRVSFAFESTLAAQTPRRLIQRAKATGYRIILLYFWLSSPELALKRVAERVDAGGHDIPEPDSAAVTSAAWRTLTRSIETWPMSGWFLTTAATPWPSWRRVPRPVE